MSAFDQVQAMNDCGIRYFNYGTQRDGRKKLFDWYMADALSPDQIAAIESRGAKIMGTQSQYAPELRRVIVTFPKGWKA